MVRTIVFILILSSKWLVGQEQRAIDHAVLHAYCDTSMYYVGDLIKYTIEHTSSADSFELDSIQELTLISMQTDTLKHSIQYTISFLALDSGTFTLPFAEVRSGANLYQNDSIVVQVNILPETQSKNFMRSEGKSYVVIAVIAIIFLGLAGYLFLLDRKISALENEK